MTPINVFLITLAITFGVLSPMFLALFVRNLQFYWQSRTEANKNKREQRNVDILLKDKWYLTESSQCPNDTMRTLHFMHRDTRDRLEISVDRKEMREELNRKE